MIQTTEDKVYGSDLENRIWELKRELRLAELESSIEGHESYKDHEESTK